MLKKAICFVILAVFVQRTFISLSFFDVFSQKDVFNHEPGPCHFIQDIDTGAEDVQMVSDHEAIFSSGLRLAFGLVNPEVQKRQGAMYLFDFNKPGTAEKLHIDAEADFLHTFNPHGLSVWTNEKTGEIYIYVVNHLLKDNNMFMDRVEKFAWNTEKLVHIKSIQDPSFGVINDLVVTGPDAFYVTNFQYSSNKLLNLLEMYVRLGQLIYYDGQTGKVVVGGVTLPNGVNISKDKKFIYLVNNGRFLSIYQRNTDNTLDLVNEKRISLFMDNINIDEKTGDLWIAGHPNVYNFFTHSLQDTPSPSQVLRFQIEGSTVVDVQQVYSDDGRTLSGSSSALYVQGYHTGALLIGTVQHKLLYCEVKHLKPRSAV